MDSNLQVISGEYRGRKLKMSSDARPTQNLARGAIFNSLTGILQDFCDDIHAWDAFAGSGALGIEVLSRFPNSTVVFTDISEKSIRAIQENVRGIDLTRYKIDKSDAASGIGKYAKNVNLVFVDPPYPDSGLGIRFIDALADAGFNGIVVQEIESFVDYMPDSTKWTVLRDKKYGRARILILRKI